MEFGLAASDPKRAVRAWFGKAGPTADFAGAACEPPTRGRKGGPEERPWHLA